MSVMTKTEGDVTVLKIDMDVLDASTVPQLKASLKNQSIDTMKIILDMELVTFMDSTGLGSLLSYYKQLRANGASIRLAVINSQVDTLFKLVKMDKVFDIFDQVDGALDSPWA